MLRKVQLQGWLTLAYGLSVVLAQGLHTHHEQDRPAKPSAPLLSRCASDHVHFAAGVPSDDDDQETDRCLGCQLLVDQQGWLLSPVQVAPLDTGAACISPSAGDPTTDLPLPRGRSPPLLS